MIYPFECDACETSWDVDRPIAKCSESSACPECGKDGSRVWLAPRLSFAGGRSEDRTDPLRDAYEQQAATLAKVGIQTPDLDRQVQAAGRTQDLSLKKAGEARRSGRNGSKRSFSHAGTVDPNLRKAEMERVGRAEFRGNKHKILKSTGAVK